ncbi:hypothetical protein PV11_00557 [Exophiala sideris]|uniref:RRM domain-containing protein n=1 Tax=Exophiala sideris TaxID=1016849 RepID=A0A0D1W7S6_9EURO|nr:hypothetical protein PV11_00557 [Exophiala sideris]
MLTILVQVQANREYLSLRHALVSGGVDSDTLDVLISNNLSLFPLPTRDDHCSSLNTTKPLDFPTWRSQSREDDFTRARRDLHIPPTIHTQPAYPPTPPSESSVEEGAEDGPLEDTQDEEQPQSANRPYRSLMLTALPPTATLFDITRVIRGGAIMHMYLRERDGYAHVSFVEPAAAEAFFLFAERNGAYIRGKKIAVAWDERQSYLTSSLANRIAGFGASRNLVIRHVRRYITAETIRDDLEHIHNLDVVKVQFSDGNAFISLNNIALAMTARNCMHSRQKYKGMRIEFYPDECAQPLPRERSPKRVSVKRDGIPLSNRFDALLNDSDE